MGDGLECGLIRERGRRLTQLSIVNETHQNSMLGWRLHHFLNTNSYSKSGGGGIIPSLPTTWEPPSLLFTPMLPPTSSSSPPSSSSSSSSSVVRDSPPTHAISRSDVTKLLLFNRRYTSPAFRHRSVPQLIQDASLGADQFNLGKQPPPPPGEEEEYEIALWWSGPGRRGAKL